MPSSIHELLRRSHSFSVLSICLLLVALTAAPQLCAAESSPNPSLSSTLTYPESHFPELARLLAEADARAPALISQSLREGESTERLAQAQAAYYPRLALSSNFGFRQENRSGGEDENNLGLNAALVLTRPLYHWGALEARILQARLDFRSESLERSLTLRHIQRGIRADYLNLLLNRLALRNARLQRQLIEDRAALNRSDLSTGSISSADASRTALALDESLIDIEQLEAEQARILASFKRTLGWDAPLELSASIPALDLADVGARLTPADAAWTEHSAPLLKQLNLVEREKAEYVRITARQRPLLDATVSASQGQSNTSTRNNVDTLTYFAGVSVNWNLFDGFETRHQRRESRLRQRRLENDVDNLRAELRVQSEQIRSALGFLIRRLSLQEKRHQIEQSSFTLAEGDHAAGRLASLAFRERQRAYFESELALLRNRVGLLLGLGDFLNLTLPTSTNTASATTANPGP